MTFRAGGAPVRLALVALFSGCASLEGDACAGMCDAALARFESCMDESGLEYGASVGYTDAVDYADWCDTWTWELRQLGQAASCDARRVVFEDGTCDDYLDVWEVE